MKKFFITSLLIVVAILFCSITEASNWKTDFEKASLDAKASDKYMLLDFSGSDWCGWCKRLEQEVFSQDAFKDFAEKNFVCVLVDFPRAKEQTKGLKQQNQDLADKYGIKGFPTIIILSPDGEPVAKTGYLQGGAREYARHLEKIIEEYKAK
ncbi:thioredoxin family protein [Candidatus Scalindua japonica]|nr:thioredoxin family protein [Candidatus Scalindua japonica]